MNLHLKGLIAAPFTPMQADGSLNLDLIPDYYQFLKQNGVNGAFICGSTGEGVSLTISEKKQVAEAWASCARDDQSFTIMPLLGGTCIADCIELAKHAQQIGLDAVSFTSPFYFKPANVEMLAECIIAIAETVPEMPFYYYHIPVLTGVGLPMFDLLKVLDGRLPNFAGMKYTHEDFMDFQSCLNFQNGKYDMLWGRDENMLSALAVGAKGAVGSTFNYAAPLYHELIEAFEQNDMEKAGALQQKSIDMIRLLGKYGGISVGKAYMKVVGLDCGTFRLPVKNMSDAQFQSFQSDVAVLDFDSFKSGLPTAKTTH
ncbi:dihydrodipicolinate synthase family protein [Dyadobacter fanqingshengii]|uniref:Dihydrodipicolinate synthase family protein n=1 Tax=Dyadobacter fanqingshengii TaxID=2906443 RepID=A0A9X1PAN2_9BACT|nr:dihydrodipicolinate synthase family protein [Dyadobacter fanqingshengii]MCF0039807.1 dihydrodipicolinate synthase family protein [Dyadobacter fanqingshengii]USJ38430.1 dihydrodipicolinate synthase family protein [Dyadobacter fanqingshengii]